MEIFRTHLPTFNGNKSNSDFHYGIRLPTEVLEYVHFEQKLIVTLRKSRNLLSSWIMLTSSVSTAKKDLMRDYKYLKTSKIT